MMRQFKFLILAWYILFFGQCTFTDQKNTELNDDQKKQNLIDQQINSPKKISFIALRQQEPVQLEDDLVFYDAQQGPQQIANQPKKNVSRKSKSIPSYNNFEKKAAKSLDKSQSVFNDPFFTQNNDSMPNYQRYTMPNSYNSTTTFHPQIISLENDLKNFNNQTANVFNNPVFTENRSFTNRPSTYQIKPPTYSSENDWNNFFDNVINSSQQKQPDNVQIKNVLASQSKPNYQEKLFNSRLRMDYR
ncbi:MAG: hypothetical protein ACXWL5_02365 [Candidatus Chromulinivorax sp.]